MLATSINSSPFSTFVTAFRPALVTFVTYKIVSKVMEVASRHFKWLKEYSEPLTLIATAALSAFITDRLIVPALLATNPELISRAFTINLILLGCLIVKPVFNYLFTSDSPTQSDSSLITNMTTAVYSEIPGQDEVIQQIERTLERPTGASNNVLLIGESSHQPELIVQELARRSALSPESSPSIHYLNPPLITGRNLSEVRRALDELIRSGKKVVLFIDPIELLNEELHWYGATINAYIRDGKISIIGIASSAQDKHSKILELFPSLTPIKVPPLQAEHCFAAIRNQMLNFTTKYPNITITDEALTLATLFSYHHVIKGFVLKDAVVSMSDILFEISKSSPDQPVALNQEVFFNHWKEIYQKDSTKISLNSLDQTSKQFFTEKGIDIEDWIVKVNELNKLKSNAHFAQNDMPYFLSDMNENAREGKFVSCIGREDEIDQVIATFRQPRNRNLVLLGEPGIGKTAIFEEIARRITVEDSSVESFKGKTLYWVDVNAMVGTDGIVGQIERAVSSLIKFAEQRAGEAIFVIDELHTLRGAGRHRGNDNDVLELLKTALSRNDLIIFGTANDVNWTPIVRRDTALARRINSIHVAPPSPEVCMTMLNHANTHGSYTGCYDPAYVEVTTEAIEAAIYLTESFMPERFLPDKAAVLISQAVSVLQIQEEKARKAIPEERPKRQITREDIAGCLFEDIKHTLNQGITKVKFIETLKQTSAIRTVKKIPR